MYVELKFDLVRTATEPQHITTQNVCLHFLYCSQLCVS